VLRLCELTVTCPVNPDIRCTEPHCWGSHPVNNLIGMSAPVRPYCRMERKIFWLCFIGLGLLADLLLPIWWALAATIPIGFASWWIAYRSDWF